jgi:hypothetical protein
MHGHCCNAENATVDCIHSLDEVAKNRMFYDTEAKASAQQIV